MGILQMNISAGLLIMAIALIRAVALNRLPKKMFLVLWSVVLFRLLIPVSIPLPFNFTNIFVNLNEVSRTSIPDNLTPLVNDVLVILGEKGAADNITVTSQESFLKVTPTTAIWLLGTLALLIFFSVIYYRNHKGLRYATEIRDNDFLNEWLTENSLKRSIIIMQSDRIISPLAVGIFKPRIILPKSINMKDKQLLNYVLVHEYLHIKRLDAIWKIVLLLAVCVHWFNPMVWVMFVLASRDLELTCDEMVIYRFGAETKKSYAYMLIGMAEQQGQYAPLYNGFSKNATEERIISIMKIKKASIKGILLACILVTILTVLTVGFAFNPLTEASSDGPPSIVITAEDKKIEWVASINKWDSTYYFLDYFKTLIGNSTFEELPYVINGESITITFKDRSPDEMSLMEFQLDENGDLMLEESGPTYNMNPRRVNKRELTLIPYYEPVSHSDHEDFVPGSILKGFRFVFSWDEGETEYEYFFVIRRDEVIPLPFKSFFESFE